MQPTYNEARERVLAAAEQLFADKGFGSVTLRQIGARAGIHHSSLYHHVPGGKEDLFVEVMERIFARHRAGLSEAVSRNAPDIRAQLYAAADWLLSQPPIDMVRMQYVDMPALSREHVQRLTDAAYDSLQLPIERALAAAEQGGAIAGNDWPLVSGGLVGMVQSLYAVSEEVAGQSRSRMAHRLIDIMLDGLRRRG